MASRYCWRQQLLGSLQGQLQLATYLVVVLGFTGASSVDLLIGQRNLLANDERWAGFRLDATAFKQNIRRIHKGRSPLMIRPLEGGLNSLLHH